MKIYNVTDERFKAYGKVVKDIDFSEMVRVLKEETPIPEDVAYVPGLEALESLPAGEPHGAGGEKSLRHRVESLPQERREGLCPFPIMRPAAKINGFICI